jgi:uncharacterized protein (UPF0548 family)
MGVGQTSGTLPPGFTADHYRGCLGFGSDTFEKATELLRHWQMLRLAWVEPAWPEATLQEGSMVGTLTHVMGIWSLNVCRIVYVIDEPARFGFAWGTLPDHTLCGEERFLVEHSSEDGSVWYDLLSFSRPGRIMTRLIYPFARHLQRRFALDSMEAMRRSVAIAVSSQVG